MRKHPEKKKKKKKKSALKRVFMTKRGEGLRRTMNEDVGCVRYDILHFLCCCVALL